MQPKKTRKAKSSGAGARSPIVAPLGRLLLALVGSGRVVVGRLAVGSGAWARVQGRPLSPRWGRLLGCWVGVSGCRCQGSKPTAHHTDVWYSMSCKPLVYIHLL